MKFPKAYTKNKNVNVIIETPYQSRNKFAYDEDTGLFKLTKVIPAGMEFPCDMGFIPGTRGEDGDPLDALVLMDLLTYPGCLVECRLIGAIKAVQSEEGGKEIRNDRYILVPANMDEYDHLRRLSDMNQNKIKSIVCFFENYNKRENKLFRLMELANADEAHDAIKKHKSKS